MHSYEPPRARYPYRDHGQIPAMRPPHEPLAERQARSATPIFDALYAEYRRLFRALPGDRTGEEELRFTGFGAVYGTGFSPVRYEEGRHRAPVRHAAAALPPAPRDMGR
ncbi:hypothetical protein WDH52_14550 [Streptomyces sp. TRM70308]|uniref:hypothetical protein n=1 Tax=Streptomyces TaxID=1883 RepID=UPI0022492BC2|nr:hypothetical protein [Streptomyces sp. JHD 1]MCX2970430.1 hypothetical protein [Streptomyces sp. JHD 1]